MPGVAGRRRPSVDALDDGDHGEIDEARQTGRQEMSVAIDRWK
jgi:hypothetical protein